MRKAKPTTSMVNSGLKYIQKEEKQTGLTSHPTNSNKLNNFYPKESKTMIALQTKYIPPTTHRGARIKAWATNRSWVAYVPYYHSKSLELVHFEAVKEFVKKFDLKWDLKNMRFGCVDNGYVFCFADAIVKENQ
jgi:hypothetical protein